MTDDMLGPSPMHIVFASIRHMYMTDFAYDGPIFLVPLSPSYPSSPVLPCAIVSIVVQFQWRPSVAGSAPRSF